VALLLVSALILASFQNRLHGFSRERQVIQFKFPPLIKTASIRRNPLIKKGVVEREQRVIAANFHLFFPFIYSSGLPPDRMRSYTVNRQLITAKSGLALQIVCIGLLKGFRQLTVLDRGQPTGVE